MNRLRDQFPIFSTYPNLTYLDSAATTQKPQVVIEAVTDFYLQTNAPVHRSLYPLGTKATATYEAARQTVANFLKVAPSEVIFTRGATESLNLLAQSLAKIWKPGSAVVISRSEHHANFLPWQQVGVELRVANLTATGETDLEHLSSLLDERVMAVSLAHTSNVLGSITPLAEVKKIMLEQGSKALLIADLCQSIAHLPIDLRELGCDFAVFSGHKLYGPTGIGILWGKEKYLQTLPPYQVGGEMIKSVSFEQTIWNDLPWKFEAGTPNVDGAVGMAKAIDWLAAYNPESLLSPLASFAKDQLQTLDGLTIIGNPDPRSAIISFTIAGIHPHDLAELLGQQEICIRAGHHCAAPLHQALGIAATNRLSLGLYNEEADIVRLIQALREITDQIRHA